MPRRGLLPWAQLLMLVNRVCGLALPFSTKYLVNDVMLKGGFALLMPIVLAVVARDYDSRRNSLFFDAVAFEIGPAADFRNAHQDPGSYWAVAGEVLRR